MSAIQVPVLAGAWLLAAAGIAKVRRPHAARRALHTLLRAALHRPVPLPIGAIRLLGAAEVVSATAVLASGFGWRLWLVAAWYSGFALFVIVALGTGAPLASCGCFGRDDTPPSLAHLALDAGIAACAALAATDGSLASPRLGSAGGAVGLVASVALAAVGFVLLAPPSPRR